jgi:positive regulator of sigma E activity
VPLELECPNCQAKLRLAAFFAGRRVRCRSCGAHVTAPDAEQATEASMKVPAFTPQSARLGVAGRVALPRRINYIFLAAVMCTFIGYGLPWFIVPDTAPVVRRMYGDALIGYEAPIVMNRFADQMAAEGRYANDQWRKAGVAVTDDAIERSLWYVRSLYVFYLVPLLALILMIEDIVASRTMHNRWGLRLAFVFALPLAFLFVLAMAPGSSGAESSKSAESTGGGVGIGVAVALLGSVLSLISIFFFRIRYTTDSENQ